MKKQIICTASKISDGNMSFKYGDQKEVIKNRRKFLEKLTLSLENCVVMACAHEDDITLVDETHKGRGALDGNTAIVTEAFVTNKKGIILFLLTADCFPIVYHDPQKDVIALAHLGWKPTGKHLASKVVSVMKDSFGSNPRDIKVYIGPGIHKDSYKVKDAKQKELPEWQNFIEDVGNNETKIDLIAFNKNQLLKSEIMEENIIINSNDTALSDNYFSHYRSLRTGEPEGRFVTITTLQN